MKAVLIAPGEPRKCVDIGDDLAALQDAVGGYIEAIPVRWGCTGLVNEDGKQLGLTPNPVATGLSRIADPHWAEPLKWFGEIVGTMLVVGPADANGDFTPVPDSVVALLTT